MHGQTHGQAENIIPPAPNNGRGIKRDFSWCFSCCTVGHA